MSVDTGYIPVTIGRHRHTARHSDRTILLMYPAVRHEEIPTRCFLPSTMRRFRKRPSSPTSPTDGQPPSSALPTRLKKKRAIIQPRAEDQDELAGTSSGMPSSVTSSSQNQLVNTPLDESGPSKESGWKAVYGALKITVDIAKESSDLLLPLKAVVGALSVLIKNYDVRFLQRSHLINR